MMDINGFRDKRLAGFLDKTWLSYRDAIRVRRVSHWEVRFHASSREYSDRRILSLKRIFALRQR